MAVSSVQTWFATVAPPNEGSVSSPPTAHRARWSAKYPLVRWPTLPFVLPTARYAHTATSVPSLLRNTRL